MPAPLEVVDDEKTDLWAHKQEKVMRITLSPDDWRALRVLAAERESSLHQTVSDVLRGRLADKARELAPAGRAVRSCGTGSALEQPEAPVLIHEFAKERDEQSSLATPDLCADSKAWVASGYKNTSPATKRDLRELDRISARSWALPSTSSC